MGRISPFFAIDLHIMFGVQVKIMQFLIEDLERPNLYSRWITQNSWLHPTQPHIIV